jgi:hypothetical protein
MASSASPDGGHSGWSRILLVGDMHVLGYRRHPADVLWSDWGLVKLLGVAVSVLQPEVCFPSKMNHMSQVAPLFVPPRRRGRVWDQD